MRRKRQEAEVVAKAARRDPWDLDVIEVRWQPDFGGGSRVKVSAAYGFRSMQWECPAVEAPRVGDRVRVALMVNPPDEANG